MSVVIKEVDEQGQVVIPKEWREKLLPGRKALIRLGSGEITISPFEIRKLSEFLDSIEVDLKSDLSDWHSVSRELRGKG